MKSQQAITYLDIHELARSSHDQGDAALLQSYITFRLENFAKMTTDAVAQLDSWINSLRFKTSCSHKLRHTRR